MNIFRQFKEKKGNLYKFYDWIAELINRVDRHHLFMLAAGLAFNIIVYLIPLILIAVFIVNLVFDNQDISIAIEDILMDLLPPTDEANKIIHTVIQEVTETFSHSKVFGFIGIGVLLWLSSLLVSSLRYSLNTIFELKSPKIYFFYKLKDIIITIGITILIFLYSYAVPIVSIASEVIAYYFPEFLQNFAASVFVMVASVITSFLMFLFIFRIVPNNELPRKVVITSTIICVISIELARNIFAWYLTDIASYGKFYGTYAVIVSMAIWIYYSSLIILLSAEISKLWYDRKRLKNQKA